MSFAVWVLCLHIHASTCECLFQLSSLQSSPRHALAVSAAATLLLSMTPYTCHTGICTTTPVVSNHAVQAQKQAQADLMHEPNKFAPGDPVLLAVVLFCSLQNQRSDFTSVSVPMSVAVPVSVSVCVCLCPCLSVSVYLSVCLCKADATPG